MQPNWLLWQLLVVHIGFCSFHPTVHSIIPSASNHWGGSSNPFPAYIPSNGISLNYVIKPTVLEPPGMQCERVHIIECANDAVTALKKFQSLRGEVSLSNLMHVLDFHFDVRKCVLSYMRKFLKGIYISEPMLAWLLEINNFEANLLKEDFIKLFDHKEVFFPDAKRFFHISSQVDRETTPVFQRPVPSPRPADALKALRCDLHLWYTEYISKNVGKRLRDIGLTFVPRNFVAIGGLSELAIAASKERINQVIEWEITRVTGGIGQPRRVRKKEPPSVIDMDLDFEQDDLTVLTPLSAGFFADQPPMTPLSAGFTSAQAVLLSGDYSSEYGVSLSINRPTEEAVMAPLSVQYPTEETVTNPLSVQYPPEERLITPPSVTHPTEEAVMTPLSVTYPTVMTPLSVDFFSPDTPVPWSVLMDTLNEGDE